MHPTLEIRHDRVRMSTADDVNDEIDYKIRQNISYYSQQNRASIQNRIDQLEEEWDIERTLELNAALLSLIGVGLSAVVGRRWLILPAVVTIFLTQHALQGWCPPLTLFRRLNIRTQKEIETEKHALLDLLNNKPLD